MLYKYSFLTILGERTIHKDNSALRLVTEIEKVGMFVKWTLNDKVSGIYSDHFIIWWVKIW